MTIVVIADIHNKTRWIEPALQQLKKEYNWDKVVFTGDYFDNWGDNAFIAAGTAKWLKQSLPQENRIHLLGNHDMPYLMPLSKFVMCPGYTPEKRIAIREVLTGEDCNIFRPACTLDGWLFSHAGFTQTLMNYVAHPIHGVPKTPLELVTQAEIGLQKLKEGSISAYFQQGARMGENTPGGITWADWDMEFVPIKGINQMVGHTPHPVPQLRTIEGSINYDIDTSCRFIVVIKDGKPIWVRNTFN